jgi:hypothetical protein
MMMSLLQMKVRKRTRNYIIDVNLQIMMEKELMDNPIKE